MFGIRRPCGACWMVSVTERVKTLFFSPLQPRNAGGGVGGGGRGGRGGIPCPLPSSRSSRFSHLSPLRLPPARNWWQMAHFGVQAKPRWPGPQKPLRGPGPKLLPGPKPGLKPREFLGFSPGHPKLGAGRPACSCKLGFLHRLFSCAQSRLKISRQS